jgi:iron complex outermembrane receptor protein
MDFRTYRRVRTFIVSLLATALVRTVWAEPASPPVEFHIEGGDATSTLTEFSRQAHLQLLFDYNVVKGHTTRPLEGTFVPSEALQQLLANTDLEFDFVNDRTLAVTQKQAPTDTAKLAANEPKREPRRWTRPKSSLANFGVIPIDVVRITGTSVTGEPPIGEEIISATRNDIEATGAATPSDFLRTLPQVFGGGPNQDTHIGAEALTNSGLGVGVNLRGLGARATLVLLNGRRIAPSGTTGEFVDIENIPLSAVDRIDILPDSASAMFGADAIGGVVNFVLRDTLDGGETTLRGGSGTRGDLQEYLISQTLGKSWNGGHALIALEFYDRGPLSASDRAYAVSDLRSFGGGDFDTPQTNPGNIFNRSTGQTWAIPANQNGTHLTAPDLVPGTVNLQNQYLGAEIVPDQKRWTLYGTGRQELTNWMSAFADILVGHREASEMHSGYGLDFPVPNTNPFYVNPMGGTGSVQVRYNFGKDLGPIGVTVGIDTMNAAMGVDFDLGSWTVKGYGAYTREKQNQVVSGEINYPALAAALADPDPLTAFNPFGAGSNTNPATLQAIRANNQFWLNSQLKSLDLTADGPIGTLAGIPLKLAVGANWREESFETTPLGPAAATLSGSSSNLGRKVLSGFGQLVAPVFGNRNTLPGLRRLDLSAAVRYEDYTAYGNTTTPKYGIVWSPVDGISLRGTWSRGIRPPTLVDRDESHNTAQFVQVIADPKAPGGQTTALAWLGNNASVQPERAQSWTAGLDLAPPALPGVTLDLTYFGTTFKDRIQDTQYTANVLSDPSYAAIVTRNPSAAQIDYICNHSPYIVGASAAQCPVLPVGAVIDLRVRNLARAVTDGIDFNAGYEHAAPLGKLNFTLSGTWLREFSQAQMPGTPLTSLLNTQNEPINLRFRASADWQYRGWGTLAAANFINGYRDTASIPERSVDSWTTIDLQLRYDFPDEAHYGLRGTRIELNARNVFNVAPPFLNNQVTSIGYDQENADPYGRLLSLQLTKKW